MQNSCTILLHPFFFIIFFVLLTIKFVINEFGNIGVQMKRRRKPAWREASVGDGTDGSKGPCGGTATRKKQHHDSGKETHEYWL